MNTILGTKLGMSQVFDESAQALPVTVIKAGPCRVVQVKTSDRDGYEAVQLSLEVDKAAKVNQAVAGHFAKAGVTPSRHLVETAVDDTTVFEPGATIKVDEVFEAGVKADVTGVSKGKGFAGVMKRHNFSGQCASHGNHKKHRAGGAIGACATPSRVFKGKRMPGRMGAQRTTVLNLEVVQVLAEEGLILIRGAVPGPKGGLVMVRKAVKAGG
jgi:large subunit ribosomal protein L3